MASELLQSTEKTFAFGSTGVNRLATERMRKDFQFRISALILAFVTVAAVVFAGINFFKEGQFAVPDDGALWVESGAIQAHHILPGGPGEKAGLKPGDRIVSVNGHAVTSVNDLKEQWSKTGAGAVSSYEISRNSDSQTGALTLTVPVTLSAGQEGQLDDGVAWSCVFVAKRIVPDGPADKAGIKAGDHLLAIHDEPLRNFAHLVRQLYKIGVWQRAKYELDRNGVGVSTEVIPAPVDKSINQGLRLIALIYLGIGIYVLLRRWTAPKSTHFYLFCLVSFVLYSFHFTGKFNAFDWLIF